MSTGIRCGSKASAFQVIIQGPRPIRHPSTGDIIGYQKELVAEFGGGGKEVDVTGPGGELFKTADIRGHYFDSLMQQEEKGWTDEERERVEAGVLRICNQQPGQVWLIEDVKVAPPWPTYDSMQWKEIVAHAKAAGMVGEALQYESQRDEPRRGVIDGLQAVIAADTADAEAERALTVA